MHLRFNLRQNSLIMQRGDTKRYIFMCVYLTAMLNMIVDGNKKKNKIMQIIKAMVSIFDEYRSLHQLKKKRKNAIEIHRSLKFIRGLQIFCGTR